MKTLSIAILLSLQISGLQAAMQFDDEGCKNFAGLADLMMTSRQNGVPLADMIEMFSDDPYARLLVIEAYKVSRYHSESVKKIVTEDFRDKWALACYTQDESS